MAGTTGKGTTIGHSTTSGGTYTVIAKVKGHTPNEIKEGDVDTTCFDDTDDQFLPDGFKNGGEYEFDLLYVTSATATLFALVGTMLWWEITLPDTHVWAFQGYINSYKPNIPLKGAIVDKIKIKVTGTPTYT